MMHRNVPSAEGAAGARRTLIVLLATLIGLSACTGASHRPFDPKTCMETVPRRVPGLEILQGPRTRASVIRDMVPVVCNAKMLFLRMKKRGEDIEGGTVVFRVRVEYTGEVAAAAVAETRIGSARFLREVSDFIMDTDFVGWARHDTDTVFLYPMTFGE
jgi:hypothetical protein